MKNNLLLVWMAMFLFLPSVLFAQDTQLDETELKESIEKLCREYWAIDREMRAKCQDKQFTGVANLAKGKPPDIGEAQWHSIFDDCAEELKNDFKLRWWCVNYQLALTRKAERAKLVETP